MRIAVLNDIHGNVPALDAVLKEVREARVDRIVVGGDVFPGPEPHVVLTRLQEFGVPVEFIYGNGEVAVREQLAGKVPSLVPEPYRPVIKWNAEQLDAAQRQMLAGWPMTLRSSVPGLGDVLFCHATPRNENEIFTHQTAEEKLLPIFDAANASLVVCGHTHMQFDRSVGKTRVVNAGSVGMPFGPPGADWLILGRDVELRHTDYDLQAAAAQIRRGDYPGAEEFAEKYVLHPPTAAEILAVYAPHELKV